MSVLTEEEIRPKALMVNKTQCVEADRQFLLDRQKQFVAINCPACESLNHTPRFVKHGFHYSVCLCCETLFMNPRPDLDLLHKFYATSLNYGYWNDHIFPATEESRRQKIFHPRAQRLAAYCRKLGLQGGEFIEVGAAFGTLLEEVQKMYLFQKLQAVEATPALAETCRKRGFDVFACPIEQVPSHVRCDVIASFETIEHLYSPTDFVKQCARLLRPSGLLVLTTPNVNGFDIATLGTISNTINHEHLNYFHLASLSWLIEREGFKVLEVETPGQLDAELVRKEILAGNFGVSDQPFLRTVLLDEWEKLGPAFQRFLVENKLSSHMWIVARKRMA